MIKITRRQFLALSSAAAGAVLLGSGCAGPPVATAPRRQLPVAPSGDQAYLAVARGADPAEITKRAIAALGGIERFVKSGHDVIIKPNICVDYHPAEYAATTNPIVVATLVSLCLGAGAKRVQVMDMPFGGMPDSAYAVSGIGDAVKDAGGEMEVMSRVKFVKTVIPEGRDITEWEIYQDALKADVLINVPIAKHHSLARLTLGSKNLLGLVSKPSGIHRNLGQRVADLASLIRPTLTVVDAVRILTAHGPTGGSLNDVKETNTVIASHDLVAADAYGATLFGLIGPDIAYIKAGAEIGLGTLDLKSIKVEEISTL
ncbi:MAG: DUF362 domain-containing protein [Anaerolineales bacterium]|nr:DUF362 domain-containing protein [Anaerolineales bacterium]